MNRDDAEEYTQALGQVTAGGFRQVLLGQKLGVPQALGLSVDQWVTERLGGYVRMAIPERREAVKELVEEGLSHREIGDVLGIAHTTVQRDIRGTNVPIERIYRDVPGTNVPDDQMPDSTPLFAVVDLETGEIVEPEPARAMPAIREPTAEERAFDRLVGVSSITQMDPDAVAEAATKYRGEVARMYLRRAEELADWHGRLVDAMRELLSGPVRAVR